MCNVVRDRHPTLCRVRAGSAKGGVASTTVWFRFRTAHRRSQIVEFPSPALLETLFCSKRLLVELGRAIV